MLFDPFTPFDLTRSVVRQAFVPAADVAVGDGDMVLTMDLPGLTADDLEIELVDGFLSVRGERKRPELAQGSTWAHTERAFGAFERRVRLPDGVDPEAITASFDNGVLSLIVPKPERLRRRPIEIRSGEQRELASTTA